MKRNALKVLAAVVPAALLSLAGCRSAATSPCAPPPCAPEPMRAPIALAPAPAPAPQQSAETADRLRIQEETIARQQALISENQAERDRLAEQARAMQIALEKAKTAPTGEDSAERLEDELKGMQGARVMREGCCVLVIVTDCFESGSERLKPNPDVRAALLSSAAAILRHPEARVSVVGHSDSKPIQKTAGKWADNVDLSRARASSVANALRGGGVPVERVSDVEGRGSAEPLVAPERTASDRAKNRRVEIRFSFAS